MYIAKQSTLLNPVPSALNPTKVIAMYLLNIDVINFAFSTLLIAKIPSYYSVLS
jgi:hypothetical protein